jgi:hypothetical protein
MNKKHELLSKYIKTYSGLKKNKIKVLDNKKKNLRIKLEEELSKFNNLLNLREKLKKEDERYNEIYDSLVKILKSRGILFNIHNNNFKIKEWDNLFIKKINNLYVLMNKSGESLYTIEEKYNDAIEYIIDNYTYSLIITRKDGNLIKSQLRILEKSNSK